MAKRKAPQTKSEKPKPKADLTLDELIAGITPDNLHPEIDWGPPVGKERWWE